MKASRAAAAVVALLAVGQTACLVQVTRVSDPGTAFARARDEAVRDGGRRGRASQLNVLAWDPSDREMVRVSVPLWLVRGAEREIDWEDMDADIDRRDRERWGRRMGKLRWEDIERAGPGILLEVTEDEGDRVLIWLR